MQQLQIIFTRIGETKKKMRDIRAAYKDALATSAEYKEVTDKIKTLREKKKQLEYAHKQSFASELAKLDDLKIDLASDMELLSDAAMTQLMKGETVEVEDEYGNKYDPAFKVNFKKK